MKKRFPYLFFLGALFACSGVVAQNASDPREITEFLETNYGMVFKPSFMQKSRWDCPAGRMIRPSGNATFNFVCRRQDPSYYRSIMWRDGDERIKQIEADVFKIMAGGKDAPMGEALCTDAPLGLKDGRINGVYRDCKLPLPNGEFYVSFANFKHKQGYFTLLVRNNSPTGSTSKVAADLREWLAEINFAE